jgi:phosphate transport system substrate-binding protein
MTNKIYSTYKGLWRKCGLGDEGVSPIVATLILIVVAIIGGAAVALILGSFSSSVSQQANTGNTANTASIQVGIADSLIMQPTDKMVMNMYNTNHTGVYVKSVGGADDSTSITAVGMNIADIGATSTAPNVAELYKYPNLQTTFIGGRALVMISNPGLTTLNSKGISQGDMLSIYGTASGNSVPSDLNGLTAVATDTSNDGVSAMLASWLTYGASENLKGMMTFPQGVTSAPQTSEAAVISYVASTPGSIGFVDWGVLENSPQLTSVQLVPILNMNNGLTQVPNQANIIDELYSMQNAYYDSGLCSQLFYITNGQPDAIVKNYIDWAMEPTSSSGLGKIGFISAGDIGSPNLYTGDNNVVLTVGGSITSGVTMPTLSFTMQQLEQYPTVWTSWTYGTHTVNGMGVPLIDILNNAGVGVEDGVLGWGYDNYTAQVSGSDDPNNPSLNGLTLDYYTGASNINHAGGNPGIAKVLPYTDLLTGNAGNSFYGQAWENATATSVCFTKGGGGVAELSLVIPEATSGSYMSQELGYIQVGPLVNSPLATTDQTNFDAMVETACKQDDPNATMPTPWAELITGLPAV